MVKFTKTKIPGVYIVNNFISCDSRGLFFKIYRHSFFSKLKIKRAFKECFFSVSKKNVLRGMHFQKRPHEVEKIFCAVKGSILAVVLDTRRMSKTYKKFVKIRLTSNKKSIFVPKGCAAGFLSLQDDTTVMYLATGEYKPKYESGIRWDLFGMDWRIKAPILSNKDKHWGGF